MQTRTWMVVMALMVLALGPARAAQEESEWVQLFDGKTTEGWHNPYDWGKAEVVNGEIHLTSEKRKWFLCTNKQYSDFILKAEIKVPEGNSGIMFRCDVKKNKVTGYQAEVDPSDRKWSGGLYDEGGRKWFISPNRDQADSDEAAETSIKAFRDRAGDSFKPEQWNQYRIECRGDHIKIYVNGTLCTDIHDDDEANGYIAIQHHGEDGLVYKFRNIRIKEL